MKQLRLHLVEGKTTIIRQWEYHPNGTLGRYVERRTEDWTGNDQQWEMSQLDYRTTGVLSHNSWMTNRERCDEDYAENGIKVKSRRLLDNRLHGPYEELDSLGNMRLRCEYWEGLRHGWYREYNAQQELIVERLYQHGIPLPDAPEDYVKDVSQSLSREAKVWGREVVDRKWVDLDSAVTNAINREDLQIYMGRLYDGLLKPQWLSEIIESGDSGKFMGYQNMHVRLQCTLIASRVLAFRIAGWGESINITMYLDGELEERSRERTVIEMSQHVWQMPKGMWWD